MKKQAYLLKIEEPCKEHWSAMQASEQGRYCSRCTKNVIDFTSLGDAEIIRILQGSNDKVCGRFNTSQLNRNMHAATPHSDVSPVYKALAGALLLSATEANANHTLPEQPATATEQIIGDTIVIETPEAIPILPSDSIPKVVNGTVKDARTSEPLIGCNIIMKNGKITEGTTTDINGNFKFIIPDELFNDTMIFEAAYIGYNSEQFTVYKTDLYKRNVISLKLDMNAVVLGGVICVQSREEEHPPWDMLLKFLFH